jgi:hypothetical protein
VFPGYRLPFSGGLERWDRIIQKHKVPLGTKEISSALPGLVVSFGHYPPLKRRAIVILEETM